MAQILLAEDDVAVRDFARRVLERAGHDITAVHEGQEALRCLTMPGGSYDLLLSDIRMPVIDGCTLANLAFKLQPRLPVLLMTGYATDEGGALAPNVKGVLSKPFTLDRLEAAVDEALGGRLIAPPREPGGTPFQRRGYRS